MKNLNKIKARLVLFLAICGLVFVNLAGAEAATLTTASLTLSNAQPSASSSYTFQASGYTTGTSIQCITMQFNTASDMSGTVPTGMTTTSSALSASSTLITPANWTINNGTNGTVKLTYATGQAPAASGNLILTGITNGSTSGTAYFMLINTYTASGCTGAVDTDTVGFIYTAGQAVSVTINPLLTFSVAGVASSIGVNGATTNFATTSTTIPFGTSATVSTNGVGAQALTVSTNSGNGYNLTVNFTGNLTNGSHSYANWTGTNASPTAFSAAGTENFGYTTTGEAQFSSNKWAGLSTTAYNVANSASSVNNATTTVGYQVGVSSTTPPGSYATTVVYTLTPVY